MAQKHVCSNCQNEFEGKFCPECGTKWVESPVPEPPVAEQQPASVPQPVPEQSAQPVTNIDGGDIFEELAGAPSSTPAPQSVTAQPSATGSVIDDAPRSMDGKPALYYAYKIRRWIRALAVGLFIHLIGAGGNIFFYSLTSHRLMTVTFQHEIIIMCVAVAAGAIMYFLPIKEWFPQSLLPYKYRKKSISGNIKDQFKIIEFNLDCVEGLLICAIILPIMTCIIYAIASSINNYFFNLSAMVLMFAVCLPLGIGGTFFAKALKRREDELRMHFYGTKKPAADMVLLRPYNLQKEIDFLREYKKNNSVIASYPTGTVDVLSQTVKTVVAIVCTAVTVLYMCIHCAIFTPYRVACLQAVPFDKAVDEWDILSYLGDEKTKKDSETVTFVKNDKERVTFRFKNGLSAIEYDKDYDAEKQGPASPKKVSSRKIFSDRKAFCGIPVQEQVVMECGYTDGSYRKMSYLTDDWTLQEDILSSDRFVCVLADDWSESYKMSFNRVTKLSGEFYDVNYKMESNYNRASLVLSGKGTVKNVGKYANETAPWRRYYSVIEKLTIKKGLTHKLNTQSSPYAGMTVLDRVVIESGVKNMPKDAFAGSKKLTVVWCEDKSKPDSWDEEWLGESEAVVHWGDEWVYVNGIPTLRIL